MYERVGRRAARPRWLCGASHLRTIYGRVTFERVVFRSFDWLMLITSPSEKPMKFCVHRCFANGCTLRRSDATESILQERRYFYQNFAPDRRLLCKIGIFDIPSIKLQKIKTVVGQTTILRSIILWKLEANRGC